jgi:hypothetical protein
VPIVLKSGSLNLLGPSGPVQTCNGIALPTKNSVEMDVETKESTRKTEEILDGRYKKGHERKK